MARTSKQRPCALCTWAFWSAQTELFPPLVFSLFLGEHFLVGPRRKQPDSTIYFPFLISTKRPLKMLYLYFSLLNFSYSLKFLQTNDTLNCLDDCFVGLNVVAVKVLLKKKKRRGGGWVWGVAKKYT